MKIVYFFRALAIKGGLEKILVDKMNYLSECYGYDVYIITSDQNIHPLAYKLHSKVKQIDLNINFYQRFKYKFCKRFSLYYQMKRIYKMKINQILEKIKPDILVFTTNSLLEMTLVRSLRISIPIIVESHTARNTIEIKRNFLSTIYYFFLQKNQESSLHNVDALVCLTNADATLWKNIKRAIVIPNMINRPAESGCVFDKERRILCVGRLSEEKGYDLLIKAWQIIFRKYPEWRIDIYGTGEKENELLKEIKELGLSNINMKGITNNVNEEYLKSDFLVLSSRFEGFGLVLAEAMACGIPCVAFNCPCGPSEIITNRVDGLLVENGNVDALAYSIGWMIDNKEDRLRMGASAKHDIERFFPENIMPRWNKLFTDIAHVPNK